MYSASPFDMEMPQSLLIFRSFSFTRALSETPLQIVHSLMDLKSFRCCSCKAVSRLPSLNVWDCGFCISLCSKSNRLESKFGGERVRAWASAWSRTLSSHWLGEFDAEIPVAATAACKMPGFFWAPLTSSCQVIAGSRWGVSVLLTTELIMVQWIHYIN